MDFLCRTYIPYGWQEKGETITLKSGRSKRLNVLGLINRRNEFVYESYTGTTSSDTIINFLDKFSENLSIKTIVVMDQASIHTSDIMLRKLSECPSRKLEIFCLPTYSPKLNLIEILWKFIKDDPQDLVRVWIEIEAYENWKSLVKYVNKVRVWCW